MDPQWHSRIGKDFLLIGQMLCEFAAWHRNYNKDSRGRI